MTFSEIFIEQIFEFKADIFFVSSFAQPASYNESKQ